MGKPLQHPAELAEYTHAINRIETINAKTMKKAVENGAGRYYYPAVQPQKLFAEISGDRGLAG
jgi:hypothetical protein